MALPEKACNAVYATSGYDGSSRNMAQTSLQSDNVFGEDGGELQLATISGDTTAGYVASLVARVDTTTTPSSGTAPGRR